VVVLVGQGVKTRAITQRRRSVLGCCGTRIVGCQQSERCHSGIPDSYYETTSIRQCAPI
jgi:hypothetical protein